MPDRSRQGSDTGSSVGEIVEFVTAYAKQETVEPMRGAGRWIAWGLAGSLLMTIGVTLLLLGALRLLQTELFTGRGWSWVPYVVVAALCAGVASTAGSRINKTYLYKEDR